MPPTAVDAVVLSVLVPTYNYAGFIGTAIASVLEQAMPGVEILVADDGSTDDTEAVLRPLVVAGRVRYHRQPNRGPAAARNLAIAEARGQLLMFLDADDILLPGCLTTTIGFLDRHPEVGLFFTNYDIFDDTGVISASGVDLWRDFRGISHRVVEPDGWIFTESLTSHIIRRGAFMHTSGLTLRRAVVEQAGPFREGYSYAEDDEFYARAAHVCTAGYVDQLLSRKRNHPQSLIHNQANRLRNSRHLLELTEIQLDQYGSDPMLQRILRAKVQQCTEAYCWQLIEADQLDEAQARLRRAISRYPWRAGLYKQLLKSVLLRYRGHGAG